MEGDAEGLSPWVGVGLWDPQGPSHSAMRPPKGNNVPREQQEPLLITNCSVIFLLLPGQQQGEPLKRQQEAAGSFKAMDDFPLGFTFPTSSSSPSPCPPVFFTLPPSALYLVLGIIPVPYSLSK